MAGWTKSNTGEKTLSCHSHAIPRRRFLRDTLTAPLVATLAGCGPQPAPESSRRPNILFAISDDVSWLHNGAAGDPNVRTPAFDRVAKEGVLFTHAFTAAPSCTPSRSAVLTGQAIWRLEEGGLLWSTLPAKFDVYPLMLETAGYHVGFTGKGWGPGDYRPGGRQRDPTGQGYQQRRYDKVPEGISAIDYAANFEDFLRAKPAEQPFCFWFGGSEAHLPYAQGAGLAAGKKLANVSVPPFLPDADVVRGDILDYYVEIEWFDSHLARMLASLEQAGELDNTLIVVTSDNGMPFPRAKTTLYDWGVRMPLAIRWGQRVPGGRVVDDFVSHTDFAPTFLAAAGLAPPAAMTGRSLLDVLFSGEQGRVDASRDKVFTAIERHTWCRPKGVPYPSRAIRTHDYLYIRNYEPGRWPAGDPDFDSTPQGFYGDIDRSPTKTFMMEPANQEKFPREFALCFGKRPAEELYHLAGDPGQIHNLAAQPEHAEVQQELRQQLERYLAETKDPRVEGRSPWDDYPYLAGDNVPKAKKKSG